MKRFVKGFGFAIEGFIAALRCTPNLWFHLLAAAMATVFGLYFRITKNEWLALVLIIGAVISAELFNTALEKLTDLAEPNINPLAKLVKDVAAAAVLVLAIASLVIAAMVFVPHLQALIQS